MTARRRQLQSQGQAVEAAADLGHGRGVGLGQGEGGLGVLSPLDEQSHRPDRRQLLDGRQVAGVGQGQGRHLKLALAPQPQADAAGRQHRQVGAGGEQVGDERGGGQHVLEVVQDQQRLARAQEARQCG